MPRRVRTGGGALLAALLLAPTGPSMAVEPGATKFAGRPGTAQECAAYVAEGSRLMGLAAETMIASAKGAPRARPPTMPASPAPVPPVARPAAAKAAPGSGAAPPASTRAARDLVSRGSKLFHLGLACESAPKTP